MIFLILPLLFATPTNCQLAFTWLNHQHFQCAQHTRNHREAIQHQYMCIFSHTWMCITDAIAQSYTFMYLDHFCGFINLRYAAQSKVIWNIHMKPNIHVHFLDFSLSSNYWYCDFEYLRAVTTNEYSTFCGNRLPWVYDASDSSVKIIFFTKRFSSQQYRLQFQYYGANAPNYQHFVLLMKPSATKGIHLFNIKRNEFETFHFISNGRLEIVYIEVVKACNILQLDCYDGPGIKSPNLHCKQACKSKTFQMVCRVSIPTLNCSKVPSRRYYAIQ